jgi:hypothetical protein
MVMSDEWLFAHHLSLIIHTTGSPITQHSLHITCLVRKPLILLSVLFVLNFEKLAVM